MKVSDGFLQACSTNLPWVDTAMMMEFTQNNEKFNLAGIRGAKAALSSRSSYVSSAVGYVEVRRESDRCLVQCRITPEQRVRNKMYKVTAEINEKEDTVIDVSCHDCAASEGGCKHALCFLMWLVKRTEEPASTSVDCYWNRPKLSDAITKDKFIALADIGKKRPSSSVSCNIPSLQDFLEEAKKHKVGNSLIMNYNVKKPSLNDYCVFDMMLTFVSNTSDEHLTFKHFISYARDLITSDVISNIELSTKSQVNSKLWHAIRQSRITASRIHETTRCTTSHGSLVQAILGQYKVPETKAIKRGKKLEVEVIKKLQTDMAVEIIPAGFTLITPIIGASPDGVASDFVVEVKCPTSKKNILNYVKNNKIGDKFKAQIQIQMCATKKNKGLFCVADPHFESNGKIYRYWINYDRDYVDNLISAAEKFWELHIFNSVLESVQ